MEGKHSLAPTPVSIVIPLYNKRRTVSRTIDSILGQTYRDFELIIVDDGSTDDGPQFIEQNYNDPRIRVIRQSNAGPGAARNRGVRESRGPYVTFLDADDWTFPEHLQTAVEVLDAHPDCVAFTANFTMGDDKSDRWALLGKRTFAPGVWELTPQTPQDELRHCADAFNNTTAVYRRDAFERAGGFFEERCTLGEDAYLWIRLILAGPIYRCPTLLAHYDTGSSELGIGARRSALPLEPVLTHAETLRRDCPPRLRDQLELWLGYQALRAAFMQLARGAAPVASRLRQGFPGARRWPLEYAKLTIRLLLARLRA